MKKIFLIVAILMLATPALAVTTVDVWADQVGETSEVEIWYSTDGNLPRAFGLNITVTDGDIVDINNFFEGECDDVNRGYGIFPGTISISGDAISDYGSPVAPNDAPGAEGTGLGTNEIVVEMGSLYTGANTPDTSALLCTIIVTRNCTVSIVENETRGGLVMENVAETPAVNFIPGSVTGLLVPVPDVLAMNLTGATTAIEGVGLVVTLPVTYECNDTEAAEEILAQAPAGGTMANPGSAVDLWVSDGQPDVPNVVGMTEAAAIAAINAVNYISVGDVTYEYSATVEIGLVISQSPSGGATVTCGSTVDIVVCVDWKDDPAYAGQVASYNQYVSNGWGAEVDSWNPGPGSSHPSGYQCIGDAAGNTEVFIQNYRVYGSDLALIIDNWMKKAGVKPNGADPRADIDHKSEVFIQNYRVYGKDLTRVICYWMKKDSDFVAGGPCPFTDAANNAWSCPYCAVPDVVDMTQADATTAIEAKGLEVGVVTTACSNTIDAGKVISSDPLGGKQPKPDCGSAVDLVVSTGPC